MNIRNNLSFIHYIKSYQYTLRDLLKIDFLFGYVKTYNNFPSVLINTFIRKKFPIEVTLRNGKRLQLYHERDVHLLTAGMLWKYAKIDDDALIIYPKSLPIVKFYNWRSGGDLIAIFISEEYKFLPIQGKTVIDIGANVGDSAIYFAMKGAEKVIALEPMRKNYESAKKNIQANDLLEKISLLLAACSNSTGKITIDPEIAGNQARLEASEKGIAIPTMTLENILSTYNIDSAILKLDCEGCEYDVILSSSVETLQKFTHMQIEYHYGYRNLKEKLEESGFFVSITNPIRFKKGEYVGYIYATRN